MNPSATKLNAASATRAPIGLHLNSYVAISFASCVPSMAIGSFFKTVQRVVAAPPRVSGVPMRIK